MPSCSVLHHCVLFLLTLTLTTDPGSAAVCELPLYAKLHQSVTLQCETQCSPGKAKWALDNNRDVVFAQCNRTSCRSVKLGYEMSHDQFKRGDLSLTITNPDYSMRETYTCECGLSDYATVRLRISTVSSPVQMSPGEDLKLDLSVPESVEVIYRRSDSAHDVHICNVTNNNVTQRSLQCNNTYTPRTSVSNSELTLRNMWRSESGTYTIRNLDYKEDIRVYAVSVSGLTSGETAGIVIAVLLFLVLLIAGVVYYMKRKAAGEKEEAERKHREVESDKEAVDVLMDQALRKPAVEMIAALQQVEEKIKDLEQKYREDREYSDHITLFCNSKRDEMVKSDKDAVDVLIKQALRKPRVEIKEALQQVEEKIKALEQKYRLDREHSEHVTSFCYRKREEIELYKKMVGPQLGDVQPVRGEVKRELLAVYEDINKTLHRAAVEEAELQRVGEKIKALQQKYRDDSKHSDSVTMFCYSKREYLGLYRVVFITGNRSLHSVTQEMKTVMREVAELRSGGPQEGEMVLQKFTDLEVKYRQTAEYYKYVTRFCGIKRTELKYCTEFYGREKETLQVKEVESEMDAVDDLIQKVLHTPPGEQVEKVLQEVKEKIKDLQQKYPDLRDYCHNKREELEVCREINGTQKGSLQTGTEEVINEIEEVYKLFRQYKHRPAGEVEEKINDLEKKSSDNSEYYRRVGMFWNQKRRDLELCSKLGLLELKFNSSKTEKWMEEVAKTLNELKWIADHNHTVSSDLLYHMFKYVSLPLKGINKWCRQQQDSLQKFKQQRSRVETDDKMICDVERHLRGLEQWCFVKRCELQKYREKLKHQGKSSDADSQTSHSEGEEDTALLEVKAEQK